MAERGIQTIEQISRALLADANISMTLWPWAVETAAYIYNRTAVGPIIKGKQITPYKAWNKKKPSINHMRIWGYKCVAYIPKNKQQSKLHPRGKQGVFIGYVPNTDH